MNPRTFEERYANSISHLKLVLIVVCLIAIPVTFYINHSDVGSVSHRITRIESPCIRYGPKSSACKLAFEKAVSTINRPEACAILRKAKLEPPACEGERLRIEERKEVVPHQPSHSAHQPPGPFGGRPAHP